MKKLPILVIFGLLLSSCATTTKIKDDNVQLRFLDEYIIDTAHFSHAGYVKMAEIWYSLMKEEGVSL